MVYGPLSDDQFAEVVNATGGGSMLLHSRAALQVGIDKGYAVGMPATKQHPERSNPKGSKPVTAAEIHEHRQKLTADPEVMNLGEPMHGIWQEKGSTTSWHDASERIMDRREAVVKGRSRKEKAVFDLKKGRDISVATSKPGRRLYTDSGTGERRGSSYTGSGRMGFDEISYPVKRRYGAPAGRKPGRST